MIAVEKDSDIKTNVFWQLHKQQQWLRQRNRTDGNNHRPKWRHPTRNVSGKIWLKCQIG